MRRFRWFGVWGIISMCAAASAATIQPTGDPGDTPGDAFDVSNPGISYSVGSGTTFDSAGMYDVRSTFGGEFGNVEPRNVVFADEQPIGNIDTVLVTLPHAAALTHFDLYVADDGTSGNRSMREFKLFAGATLIDDVTVLDNSGTQSYTSIYGGSQIRISDDLSNAPSDSNYTLEFIQNQSAGGVSGLRVVEFDGQVPEPISLFFIAAGLFGLVAQRRR